MFLDSWDSLESMAKDFEMPLSDLDGCEILLAYYGYESYEGNAFVLFRKDGLLYEVNGGHCSCYGLERQWDPELTTKEDLVFRMTNGNLGYRFKKELEEVLAIL